jgi:hypothetical protein
VSRSVRCRSGRSRPPGEHREPPIEPFEQCAGSEELDPGSSQLDRERQAVEAPADLGDHCAVAVLKGGLDCLRAFHEEGSGFRLGELGHGVLVLGGDPHRRAAGDERLDRRRLKQEADHLRRGVDDVLEIVEHKQQLALPEELADRLLQRPPGTLLHAQRLGDRRHDMCWIPD